MSQSSAPMNSPFQALCVEVLEALSEVTLAAVISAEGEMLAEIGEGFEALRTLAFNTAYAQLVSLQEEFSAAHSTVVSGCGTVLVEIVRHDFALVLLGSGTVNVALAHRTLSPIMADAAEYIPPVPGIVVPVGARRVDVSEQSVPVVEPEQVALEATDSGSMRSTGTTFAQQRRIDMMRSTASAL